MMFLESRRICHHLKTTKIPKIGISEVFSMFSPDGCTVRCQKTRWQKITFNVNLTLSQL